MGRGYNHEVYLRIPANCTDDIRHAYLVVPRFHELCLHDYDDENYGVCRDGEAGQFGGEGDEMSTEEKSKAYLKDRNRVLARSDTNAIRVQRNNRDARR